MIKFLKSNLLRNRSPMDAGTTAVFEDGLAP